MDGATLCFWRYPLMSILCYSCRVLYLLGSFWLRLLFALRNEMKTFRCTIPLTGSFDTLLLALFLILDNRTRRGKGVETYKPLSWLKTSQRTTYAAMVVFMELENGPCTVQSKTFSLCI